MKLGGALLVCVLGVALMPAVAHAQAGPGGDERFALLIGIERYQGRTQDIVGGQGDVNLMRDLLVRNGWRTDRIRTLTNEQATASAIREGLEWIAGSCSSPESRCVVNYTGHTKQISTGEGGEGLHEYLWPTDNRFISDTEFAGYMRRLNGYAWINIAACEAAGFDNGVSSHKRLFTGASAEDEKAYESPSWRTSVWTGLLVRDGMLAGHGDANGDGHVTLAEAFSYAAEQAPQLTARQPTGPQHAYQAGGGLHDWFPASESPQQATPAAARNCILNLICL